MKTDLVGYPLTARQQEILDWIEAHIWTHGYPPTFREIGNAFGITSTNGVRDHLIQLRRKGRISYEPLKSRTLRVLRERARSAPTKAFSEEN